MSYGFKFLNDSNQTIIDDTSVKPWFWGQAGVSALYDETFSYNELSKYNVDGEPYTPFKPFDAPYATRWTVYRIRYNLPSAYNCFTCIELPNTNRAVYYRTEKTHRLIGENAWVDVFAFIPDTVVASSADIPRVYVFVADPVPTANLSTGYGIHVFNGSQQCTYDSNKRHFQPSSVPLIYLPNPRDWVYASGEVIPGNDTQDLDLPTNMAVLLPSAAPVYTTYYDNEAGAAGGYVAINYQGVYRRVGQKIRNGMPITSSGTISGNFFYGYFYNTSGLGLQPVIVVDATPLNQGYTAPEFPASYTLSASASALEEGILNDPSLYRRNVSIITLQTAGVANGTLVAYTITGVQSSDISIPLTGNFTVSGNSATVTINALTDSLFEGTETLTLTLNNGRASVVVTISDQQTYALSASKTNPEEGQSILVYLNTTNVPGGTVVPYQIGGITQADLSVGSVSGNFTVVSTGGANGTASIQLSFSRDAIPENETVSLTLNGRPEVGINIPITDLSFGYNPSVSIQPSTIQQNQNTTIQVTGGVPNDTFQWIILDSGINPVDTFNNRWLPAYQTTAESQVLSLDEAGNFYNTVTGYDFGIGNKVLWIFTQTDKYFRSASITVSAIPTFSLTASNGTKGPLYINEGQTAYFVVNTTNIPNGTVVYPILVGPLTIGGSDVSNSAQNGLVINNNTGSFTLQMAADQTTESDPEFNPTGQEYFQLVLDYPLGTRKDTYGMVYINDTSLTPASYRVDRSATNTSEGAGIEFAFESNQTGTFYWTLTGMDFADIWFVNYQVNYGEGLEWAGQGQINSGTIVAGGHIQIFFRADQITEGAQTAVFDVRSGSITGPVLASNTVVINDTSVWPAAGTTNGGQYCSGIGLYQNYNNGNGGTYAVLLDAQSPQCGFNVWDETVTITSDAWGDYIIPTSGYFSIVIGTGQPDSGFTYNITNNWDPQPTTFPASGTLNGDGVFTNYIRGQDVFGTAGATGDKRLWVKFNYNGHVRSARMWIVPDPGTNSGGQYCQGTTLRQNKHDGRGGTYAETVQSNSPTCGYVPQYYPYMGSDYYYYYTGDFYHALWITYGAKPNSVVRYTIVAGPAYVGASAEVTSNGSGTATYDIGNAAYAAGTYTINATFPAQDASYPTGYRTLVFYWIVSPGYGQGGY